MSLVSSTALKSVLNRNPIIISHAHTQGLYVGSATCGSALALLLGREVLTPVVVRLINWFYGGKEGEEKLAAISKAVAKDGFKVVTLMRLSPAFPFAIVTLLLSLTKVKHFTHFKATALGLIPSSFVYIYAGAVGADATEGAMGPSDWAITICGGTKRRNKATSISCECLPSITTESPTLHSLRSYIITIDVF